MQTMSTHVDHPAGRRIAALIGGRSRRLIDCSGGNENRESGPDRKNQ
jgi:hypothetical protein